jgi:lipopolysaccharide export LptBFGC system permease protein LptF
MIQRVQSIWLLLAGLTILLLMFIPIVSSQSNGSEYWIVATGLYQKTNGLVAKTDYFKPLFLNTVCVAMLCIATIFTFKNRTGQKRLIIVAILAMLLLGFWIFYYAQNLPGGIAAVKPGIGAFLPIAGIIFCALAIRGIRKDEQLLRSADRLR